MQTLYWQYTFHNSNDRIKNTTNTNEGIQITIIYWCFKFYFLFLNFIASSSSKIGGRVAKIIRIIFFRAYCCSNSSSFLNIPLSLVLVPSISFANLSFNNYISLCIDCGVCFGVCSGLCSGGCFG